MQEAHRDIVAFATEVLATRQAVDHISRRFFDGRPVLFTSTEQDLSDAEQTARTLLEAFNEVAAENGHGGGKGKGKKHEASALAGGRPRPIEKGTFQETVHAVMLSLVHKKVTGSKAHAAGEVGETDLAAEMLKDLHPNKPRPLAHMHSESAGTLIPKATTFPSNMLAEPHPTCKMDSDASAAFKVNTRHQRKAVSRGEEGQGTTETGW